MKKILIVLLLIAAVFPSSVFAHATGLGSIEGVVQGSILKTTLKIPDKFNFQIESEVLDFFRTNLKVVNNGSNCTVQLEKVNPPTDTFPLIFTCKDTIENLNIHSELIKVWGYTFATSIKKNSQIKNYTFGIENKDFSTTFSTNAWLKDLASRVFDFIKLGIFHIYTGYDHILFLLAVILVLTGLKQALKTVTAFTIAHSTTLIISSLGLITLTSRFVEPIIALSIAYVAFENIFFRKSSNTFQRRWLVAFLFGLVHGLGFAGALSEINIPRNELLIDLLSFNIGIELGQLTIIAVVLPILYYANRFSWKTKLIPALSLLVGGIGSLWFLERIGLLAGIQNLFAMSSIPVYLSSMAILGFLAVILIFKPKSYLSKLKLWARTLIILAISVSVTVAFVPGIFNLKPEPVYGAVPSGVIVAWPSTNASIPSGWSRVTGLDSRFPKMIATSGTNPGATGGASSHNHSFGGHTHTISHNHTGWPGSSAGTGVNDATPGGGGAIIAGHSHPMSSSAFSGSSGSGGPANWDTTSSEPASLSVIFIKSDGTPTGIPNSAIAYFNGAAPTGWAAYATGANRLLKGAATGGDGGGTADTSSHSHTSAAHNHSLPDHTHTLTLDGIGSSTVTGNDTAGRGSHTHTAGSSSSAGVTTAATATPSNDAGDITPPWFKVLPVQNTSGGNSQPVNIIAMWDGTLASIPAGWKLCDGTNCTLNLSQDKYVRGAASSAEISNTGGASTHIHSGGGHTHTDGGATHSHNSPGGTSGSTTPPQSNMDFGEGTFGEDILAHTHVVGTSSSSSAVAHGSLASTSPSVGSASNDPLFTGVAYIQFSNSNPNAPTIKGSSPIPGSKPNKDATTITLQASATDPDGSDTVQIDWDYSSNSGGVWTNIGTTSLGSQGVTLSKTWTVSGLSTGSTYRLRARTLDNQGAASGYTTQSADWTLTSGCSPPVGGDLTISSSCAFPETVDGVDGGNITINNGITLTVNASQTIVFNSGYVINQNGAVAVSSAGQLKQTNIWMVDSDSDGWPASATQTGQDSSPGGTYRRRTLLQSDRIIDCNDAAASSTNSC